MDIEKKYFKYSLMFRRELEDPERKFLPAATDSLKLPSPGHQPNMDRRLSLFVVKLPHIQITDPKFIGHGMHTDRMSFRKFLSRFPKCVAG